MAAAEDNGAVAGGRFVFGGGHDLLDFLDAGEDGAEGDELGVRDASNEARKRGFAAAGRSPEQHRADVVAFDLRAQRLSRAEKVFLVDEFVEGARAHALGERLVGSRDVGIRGRGGGGWGEGAGVLWG